MVEPKNVKKKNGVKPPITQPKQEDNIETIKIVEEKHEINPNDELFNRSFLNNKKIYNDFLNNRVNKPFSLVYNNQLIYESDKNVTITFEENHFELFGKQYRYNGLRIIFK